MENHEEIAQMKLNLLRQLFADDQDMIQTGIHLNAGLQLFDDDNAIHYIVMADGDHRKMYMRFEDETPTEIELYRIFFDPSGLKEFRKNHFEEKRKAEDQRRMRAIITDRYYSPLEKPIYHKQGDKIWFMDIKHHVLFWRLQVLRYSYKHYFETNREVCMERMFRYNHKMYETDTLGNTFWYERQRNSYGFI
jgi:hypothetical protein